MSKQYIIFQTKHIPFIKSLIKLAQSKNQKTIMSPFDMEDIPITKCRQYLDEQDENSDMD